ncbi:hypothetical protein TrLO_g14057 [Triparma laevis f. longispina]|uniref:non-specific serine/threonine protein kinase n=1 Tax=Triparma laevis f. longispina TaxID=1714387 RepID=A0A9W7FP92_9STRA|nr:hypothetical protein TrLO_g14057 [Triparma laevis f. longispina]
MSSQCKDLAKYSIEKTLGAGSFGKALLVKVKGTNKFFVMKEIQIGHLSKKEKEASVAEATVLASMHHSNICSYVESFLNAPKNSILYIVMDFADGGDLAGAISRRKKRRNPFTESEVMNMFVQMCLALKHVHAKRILHRDLKSQNIFLTKKGVVKLGDFGIAKVLDNTGDVARTQIGTPYYLSPEICEDRPYGRKSDVWSLGCVLYEVAALDLPFQAKNLPALAHRIMTKQPKPLPSSHNYSTNLKLLSTSLLNKKPDLRPSVVAILRSDYLQRHISSLLSHTIQTGTGGMENDAKEPAANPARAPQRRKSSATPAPVAFEPPPSGFSPKKMPKKVQQQAQQYRRRQESMENDEVDVDDRGARVRAAERDDVNARARRKQEELARGRAEERIKKEKIRLEKLEEFRSQAVRQNEVMARLVEQEQEVQRERDVRAQQREREAMRKLRDDQAARRRIQEAKDEQDGANSSSNRGRGKSLGEWVGVGGASAGLAGMAEGKQDDVYEGRDGWMHREQEQLEHEIAEAKREYEEKQKMLMMKHQNRQQQGYTKRAAAVEAMKREQEARSNQYMQRRQPGQQLVDPNQVAFQDPSQEWEWRRAQAERNRQRWQNEGRDGGGGGGAARMRDERAEMDAKMERERDRMEQQRAAEMNADQARQVYLQNRQAAAAAKARHEQEEHGFSDVSRVRTGSTAAEVRRSKEMQREIDEAKKKQQYEDAYKQIAAEKAALAEKLKLRKEAEAQQKEEAEAMQKEQDDLESDAEARARSEERREREKEKSEDERREEERRAEDRRLEELRLEVRRLEHRRGIVQLEEEKDAGEVEEESQANRQGDAGQTMSSTIATQISQYQERAGGAAEGDGFAEKHDENADDVNELAMALAGAMDDEEDDDDDDDDDMMVEAQGTGALMQSIHTKIEVEGGESDDDDDDYIVMAPYRGDGSSGVGDEGISQEQEVEQMEELVRSLKKERLSRENSKIDDDDDEEDEDVQIGGGKGLMMPKGTYEDDVEEPPPTSPPRGKKPPTQPFSSPRPSSPPPPGVALEIDMSPSVSKDKAAMMEKKREAMRKKQEDRARARDEAKKKAKRETEQKERDEIIANMKQMKSKKDEQVEREVREPPMRVSRRVEASPGVRQKKKWGTDANEKAVVLQTLRSKAEQGDSIRASPQAIPKAVQRRLSKKSEGEEGINTLVGRLEKMKAGFQANPPLQIDSPGGKFRLRRESQGGGGSGGGGGGGGGGDDDEKKKAKNPFASVL